MFKLLTPEQVEQVEQIRHLDRDTDLEARVSYLARLANEGALSSKEEAEYLGYVEGNSLLAMLRAAACQQSSQR